MPTKIIADDNPADPASFDAAANAGTTHEAGALSPSGPGVPLMFFDVENI